MTTEHQPEPWFWEAGSNACPHGAEPNVETDGDAWDAWRDRHPSSDNGPICLDAPIGDACDVCSEGLGEMVPWAGCRVREHARPKNGVVPNPDADHQPVTVVVGTLECLDRECDDYYDVDGDEDPKVEHCAHIREEQRCSCQRQDDGAYGNQPCPTTVAQMSV